MDLSFNPENEPMAVVVLVNAKKAAADPLDDSAYSTRVESVYESEYTEDVRSGAVLRLDFSIKHATALEASLLSYQLIASVRTSIEEAFSDHGSAGVNDLLGSEYIFGDIKRRALEDLVGASYKNQNANSIH